MLAIVGHKDFFFFFWQNGVLFCFLCFFLNFELFFSSKVISKNFPCAMRDNRSKNSLEKFEPNRISGCRETSAAVAKKMVLRKTHSKFGVRISARVSQMKIYYLKKSSGGNSERHAYYRKISSFNDKMQKWEIIEIKKFKRTVSRSDMLRNETFLNHDSAKRLLSKCKCPKWKVSRHKVNKFKFLGTKDFET